MFVNFNTYANYNYNYKTNFQGQTNVKKIQDFLDEIYGKPSTNEIKSKLLQMLSAARNNNEKHAIFMLEEEAISRGFITKNPSQGRV